MQKVTDRDILLVVDVQNDFCPGGALGEDGGRRLRSCRCGQPAGERVRACRADPGLAPAGPFVLCQRASRRGRVRDGRDALRHADPVAGPLRPGHGGRGVSSPALTCPHAELVLRKGFREAIDSYSAFRENDRKTPTGLASYLRERGFERVTLCGLATDFCVLYSALDAARSRPGLPRRSCSTPAGASTSTARSQRAIDEMRAAGVTLV